MILWIKRSPGLRALIWAVLVLAPVNAHAIQLHAHSEGIITHQMGHLFFLFSMVMLMFIIRGKALDRQKGWRLIQFSALFFILWNLDAVAAHFFDNQIRAVKLEIQDFYRIKVVAQNGSKILTWVYYGLKLDHLFCVPAMFFLYMGLSSLVDDQRRQAEDEK
ncbi:hypothetical protein [Desulfospira joergensenii]|uniref:hypothetical protein n=1 Tax=Desulfospira joergensenii TaxID=53329 RepID=UPI0003B48263|nr:hypothetical protein [Desulfospira joergensenii]